MDDDWGDLFGLAWDAADDVTVRQRRPAAWLKRVTVCWWRHRTRHMGPGVYLAHSCWACG